MKKRLRLTRQRDFQRVLDSPRLFAGRSLVAFGLPAENSTGHRVGVAVSRQVRGAVNRNRARRRLREAIRPSLASASASPDSNGAARGIGIDVVLIARPGALNLPFAELRSETASALARVLGR